MKKAAVFNHGIFAGVLTEVKYNKEFKFEYDLNYDGQPISLTMPTSERIYLFDKFPPFFEGLLPEGFQLNMLLRIKKIDSKDYLTQIITVGNDMVGSVTVKDSSHIPEDFNE